MLGQTACFRPLILWACASASPQKHTSSSLNRLTTALPAGSGQGDHRRPRTQSRQLTVTRSPEPAGLSVPSTPPNKGCSQPRRVEPSSPPQRKVALSPQDPEGVSGLPSVTLLIQAQSRWDEQGFAATPLALPCATSHLLRDCPSPPSAPSGSCCPLITPVPQATLS